MPTWILRADTSDDHIRAVYRLEDTVAGSQYILRRIEWDSGRSCGKPFLLGQDATAELQSLCACRNTAQLQKRGRWYEEDPRGGGHKRTLQGSGGCHGTNWFWKLGAAADIFLCEEAACETFGTGRGTCITSYEQYSKWICGVLCDASARYGPTCRSLIFCMLTRLDTIMSRMYNQNGNLYKGVFDCLSKTVKTEGILAIYKGFLPHLARILPHTILTLSLAEQTNKLMRKFENRILPASAV